MGELNYLAWYKKYFKPGEDIGDFHIKTLQAMQNEIYRELIGCQFKHGSADIGINPLLSGIVYTVKRIKPDGKIICSFTGKAPGLVEFDKEDLDKLVKITNS